MSWDGATGLRVASSSSSSKSSSQLSQTQEEVGIHDMKKYALGWWQQMEDVSNALGDVDLKITLIAEQRQSFKTS